jgi:MFS family permease
VAATALGLVALTNIAGTYLFGAWAARWQRKHLLAALYTARTLAIALFVTLPTTALSVYLFAAVMGFLWLGTLPLTNGLLSQLFGMRYITTLFGFVFLWHQIGSFLGVWLGGLVFDATGSYALVWALACVLGLVSAVANLPVRERRTPVLHGQPA